MVSEETLEKVREAFYNVRRGLGLNGWDLDDKVVSPFLHESNPREEHYVLSFNPYTLLALNCPRRN